jgi:hypothetical protein
MCLFILEAESVGAVRTGQQSHRSQGGAPGEADGLTSAVSGKGGAHAFNVLKGAGESHPVGSHRVGSVGHSYTYKFTKCVSGRVSLVEHNSTCRTNVKIQITVTVHETRDCLASLSTRIQKECAT